MQIGIDDLTLAEILVFIRKRFFYLDNHFGSFPDLSCGFQNGGSCFDIVFCHKSPANTGIALDINLVSCVDIAFYVIWSQTNTVLKFLNFPNASDPHISCLTF